MSGTFHLLELEALGLIDCTFNRKYEEYWTRSELTFWVKLIYLYPIRFFDMHSIFISLDLANISSLPTWYAVNNS
jgi:hypothetical protein